MEPPPGDPRRVVLGDEVDRPHARAPLHHLGRDDEERRPGRHRRDREEAQRVAAGAGRPRPRPVPEDQAEREEDGDAEGHGVEDVEQDFVHGAGRVAARRRLEDDARPERPEEREHPAPEGGREQEPRRQRARPPRHALNPPPPTPARRARAGCRPRSPASGTGGRPRGPCSPYARVQSFTYIPTNRSAFSRGRPRAKRIASVSASSRWSRAYSIERPRARETRAISAGPRSRPHGVAAEREGEARLVLPDGAEVGDEMEALVLPGELALVDHDTGVYRARVHGLADAVERHDDGRRALRVEREAHRGRRQLPGNGDAQAREVRERAAARLRGARRRTARSRRRTTRRGAGARSGPRGTRRRGTTPP